MTNKVLVFLTNHFEEIEALSVVDILRRAELDVRMVSLTGDMAVTGSHQISVLADCLFENADKDVDMIVFPGGPGTAQYRTYSFLVELAKQFHQERKYIAAICAAPTFLAEFGILDGKTAVCYPSLEHHLHHATLGQNIVEVDGHIITSKGPATSIAFALTIVELLKGRELSSNIAEQLLVSL